MRRFSLTSPVFTAETKIARVWKTTQADGSFAALKVYHADTMGNEGPGFAFLKALEGASAAKVYAHSANAAVIEWLDGPSLGDLVRSGQEQVAMTELAGVATRIQSSDLSAASGLQRLDDWFSALFSLEFSAALPRQSREDVSQAQSLARRLLAAQGSPQALHGDLHHDNVRLGARGYCAFDAKGVVGDPAYELANAFRNPHGADDLIRDPAHIRACAICWGGAMGVAPRRMVEWAAAKTALSIAWRSGGVLADDRELELLAIQLGIIDDI